MYLMCVLIANVCITPHLSFCLYHVLDVLLGEGLTRTRLLLTLLKAKKKKKRDMGGDKAENEMSLNSKGSKKNEGKAVNWYTLCMCALFMHVKQLYTFRAMYTSLTPFAEFDSHCQD